jgi:hypothetical protein
VDSSNEDGVWQEEGGILTLVAREGSPAPGTEDGVVFSAISPALSNYVGRGRIPIIASLTGPGIDGTNNVGIWSQSGGNLHLTGRTGSAAPGTEPDVVFSAFLNQHNPPEFNNAGEITFLAALSGPTVTTANDFGIWSESGGSLHLVAREGMDAPGFGPGVKFSRFGEYGDPVISDSGKVAFHAVVNGPGVSGQGIWAEGPNGLQLVARIGQDIRFDNNAGGVIQYVDFFRGSSFQLGGRGTVFNDQNQLAFTAGFTSGTRAVVVADLNPFQPGDYNRDGTVDAADYVLWRDTLDSTTNLAADGTRNGVIDEGDWIIWRQNYGESILPGEGGAIGHVPEPATVALMTVSASWMLLGRDHRRARIELLNGIR